jgi:hypothetical protein
MPENLGQLPASQTRRYTIKDIFSSLIIKGLNHNSMEAMLQLPRGD